MTGKIPAVSFLFNFADRKDISIAKLCYVNEAKYAVMGEIIYFFSFQKKLLYNIKNLRNSNIYYTFIR